MSVTRTVAEAEISKRAQEFVEGTATGGSTTTVVDANTPELQASDDYWNETILEMTGGSNNGAKRRVQSFVASSSQLTVYGSFAAAVVSGDSFRIFRRWGPDDVQTALKRAINTAWPDFFDGVRKEVTTVKDTMQYGVPTGPDIGNRGLVAVEYQVFTDASRADWPYERLGTDRWQLVQQYSSSANARVWTVQLRFNPDGVRKLRFVFGAPLSLPGSAGDRIHLEDPELEWLYTQSVHELWSIEASRATAEARGDAQKEAARWLMNAEKLRVSLQPEKEQRPLRRTRFRVL